MMAPIIVIFLFILIIILIVNIILIVIILTGTPACIFNIIILVIIFIDTPATVFDRIMNDSDHTLRLYPLIAAPSIGAIAVDPRVITLFAKSSSPTPSSPAASMNASKSEDTTSTYGQSHS